MGQVTIGGNVFEIYGELADALVHLSTSLTGEAEAFLDEDTATQSKGLRQATLAIDRKSWQGEAAVDGQELAWPRSNVIDKYGEDVDDSAVPVNIEWACYELAAILVANPGALNRTTGNSNVSSVGAGSTRVAFFKADPGDEFPKVVQELIGQYLGSATAATVAYAGGTDTESNFDDDDAYTFNRGM